MINYIIQVILFQVLFLGVYDFFLSKETFFAKNRWYLLSTSFVSFLLPLIKLPTLQKAVPIEYTVLLPEVVLSPQKVIEKSVWYQHVNYLDMLFYSGCILFFGVFVYKLFKIIRLIIRYGTVKQKHYKLVLLPKNTKAFSFFSYIFLGEGISEDKKEKIIQHELVHSEQKHTVDLLFFEFLRIVMWFNPMIYVYQHRISLIHEFISDQIVSKTTEKEQYINNLLSDIFQVESISFINQFYKHSLIKKRIIMMTKKQSKQIKQVKYLLLVPVLSSMLLYTACSNNEQSPVQTKENRKIMYLTKEGLKVNTTSVQSYMDAYLGDDIPSTKELSLKDLTNEEAIEYQNFVDKSNDLGGINIRIFEGLQDKNRKILFVSFKEIMKESKDVSKFHKESNYFPFATLDVSPTFPGCEKGNKECFNQSMSKFIQNNFDNSIAKKLGLEKGKKRIYVQFKIGKDGVIKDIQARAPHQLLKEHAIEVVQKLPVMLPGEKEGKQVITGYTLPITFMVK